MMIMARATTDATTAMTIMLISSSGPDEEPTAVTGQVRQTQL
jgi:hypothetical protein